MPRNNKRNIGFEIKLAISLGAIVFSFFLLGMGIEGWNVDQSRNKGIRPSSAHLPIEIIENAGLEAFPNKTGNGTIGNPYRIENLTIDTSGDQAGIRIINTSKYLILYNCTIYGTNEYPGIRLKNCSNVNITDCTQVHNSRGVHISNSRNINVVNNNASYNQLRGILLVGCNNVRVSNGTMTGNHAGIELINSNGIWVTHNNVSQNIADGIRLENSSFNYFINNTILNNREGYDISIADSTNNYFSGNIFETRYVIPDIPEYTTFLVIFVAIFVLIGVLGVQTTRSSIKKRREKEMMTGTTARYQDVLTTSMIISCGFAAILLFSLEMVYWNTMRMVYPVYSLLFILSLLTTMHLWSRLHLLEKGMRARQLYLLMGLTFIVTASLFFIYILDHLLHQAGYLGITSWFNSFLGVEFPLFNISELKILMSGDSIFSFSLMTTSASFYILPLERYLKDRRSWFAMSLWICSAFSIPVFYFFENNVWVLSIGTIVAILLVLVDFAYMFYLYFSVAVRNTGKMRLASFLVALGLVMLIGTWIVGVIFSEYAFHRIQSPLEASIGSLAFLLFNTGFFTMTRGIENAGGMNKALLEYFHSKRICIVHRGPIKGRLFMCDKCNVFYCTKCREAIANAENQCWNCKTPLKKVLEPDVEIIADAENAEDSKELKVKFRTEKDELEGETTTEGTERPREAREPGKKI